MIKITDLMNKHPNITLVSSYFIMFFIIIILTTISFTPGGDFGLKESMVLYLIIIFIFTIMPLIICIIVNKVINNQFGSKKYDWLLNLMYPYIYIFIGVGCSHIDMFWDFGLLYLFLIINLIEVFIIFIIYLLRAKL